MAAGVVGALALTACGGSGGDDASSSAPSASTAPSGNAASPPVTGASAGIQGSWIAGAGGKIVALVVSGKQAGIFQTGGTMCNGTAGAENGAQVFHLNCSGGAKDRTTGRVDSVDGTTLKVTWSGKVGQETYTKAEGGKLPSGLPTVPAR
ncbi:hypothetical protein GT045_11795 [Streptomyces sp. SID486]|nr:hypothetical protein [Streptomyces sp. SID486]MYX95473.1 hypothetical protein [Streptomyces sp. SID486]